MADRPILFSGPMVRALLDGRKTQTRRTLKLGRWLPEFCGGHGDLNDPTCWGWEDAENGDWITLEKDPGQRLGWRDLRTSFRAGDRLWVRETWSGAYAFSETPPSERHSYATPDGPVLRDDLWYWADGEPMGGDYERPRGPLFMPRWASRLTLTVTDVRVQRVQEISEADAIAAGAPCYVCGGPLDGKSEDDCHCFHRKAGPADFTNFWDSLNAKRGFGWDVNPWVCALTFTVHRCNIDQMEASHA